VLRGAGLLPPAEYPLHAVHESKATAAIAERVLEHNESFCIRRPRLSLGY
jgi:hypothetical protein